MGTSSFNIRLALIGHLRPGSFNLWVSVKAADQPLQQVVSLGGGELHHLGFYIFKLTHHGNHRWVKDGEASNCRMRAQPVAHSRIHPRLPAFATGP